MQPQKRKILLTGVDVFISYHLTEALLCTGFCILEPIQFLGLAETKDVLPYITVVGIPARRIDH